MNDKVYGVSVFIQKDDLILAVARRDDPDAWGLVGGKVDENETPEEAAIRETFEETGLTIFNLKEINRRINNGHLVVSFSCDYTGTPTTQPGEPECKWVSQEVLEAGPFGEYNKALFEKLGLKGN